jgi:hypothetical protein
MDIPSQATPVPKRKNKSFILQGGTGYTGYKPKSFSG